MFHILVVEGSSEYQEIISRTLAHHKITICGTFVASMRELKANNFSLIVMDFNLPDGDGYSLLNEIRSDARNSQVRVLCLTGRQAIADKVAAFNLGADDYMAKPFDPLELRARADAKLKRFRGRRLEGECLTVGSLEIDLARHRVSIKNGENRTDVEVTQNEFKLLSTLAKSPDQVFSRDQLLVAAWGEDARVLERVVDVHFCSLRKKLGLYSRYIKAVSGIGYKLVPDRQQNASV